MNILRFSTVTRRLVILILQTVAVFGGIGVTAAMAQEPVLTLLDRISVLDFGRRNVGQGGAARTLTFAAGGSSSSNAPGARSVSRISFTGVNPGDFSVINDTCSNVSVDGETTCTVTISFIPRAAGNRSARLAVDSGADGARNEMPLAGYGVDPSQPTRAAGPVDMRHGFPLWYQDETGLKLALCLESNGLCLGSPPDATSAAVISDARINFADEAFWWSAEAQINRAGGGKALLVLAKEATFVSGVQTVGEQIVFDRIRIRVDRLVAGKTYKVTHPYGVTSLVADSRGEINLTLDTGCLSAPCDYEKSLNSTIRTFLRWDPAVAPLAQDGYLGDPNFSHKVIGSPLGTNYFKVEGQNAGGTNINVIQTDLFTVQGKVF